MVKKVKLKEHTAKYVQLSKQAGKGEYPSKRIAKAGSAAGGVIGAVLTLAGLIGAFKGFFWGFGILFAGLITIVSNIINLKRIK